VKKKLKLKKITVSNLEKIDLNRMGGNDRSGTPLSVCQQATCFAPGVQCGMTLPMTYGSCGQQNSCWWC
jgi:hypothetical protein